ncbi:hypothetical protein XENTR_v10010078 [Xenopus tropicalis]|uniref:Retbindin n=1 Tax=Xenopus tropicalis TaxID=8364 RepID=A0A1B8Y449_XENTR|nr:retbindin [Xenopus tropicalis]KAE8620037.1 hypothetical protein XENTR_v10010078 [Xenopus tropicalis]|eukprot:XP_004915519.1 PREDICTED: retbindin [Xenopus tropicalis]
MSMSSLFFSLSVSLLLFSLTSGSRDRCLPGRTPNLLPRAEAKLLECQQYSEKACCTQEQISAHPITNFPWGLCGSLSPSCQKYVSQVQCLYLCSPHISAYWNPDSDTGIYNLPLCSGFCDQWFEACKDDLICTLTNETIPRCADACVPYKQMFKAGGKDLCNGIWGDSLVASPQDCSCVSPAGEGEKHGNSHERTPGLPCPKKPRGTLIKRRARRDTSGDALALQDAQGSGSGF